MHWQVFRLKLHVMADFGVTHLCNFFGRWPDIPQVDIFAILPRPNWLLLKVNVNLEILPKGT